MALKVLGSARATCTLRIIAVAKALNIPLEIETIDMANRAHKDPEYLKNYQPFGRIPVLIDGDFKLFESRAICRYLVHKYQTKDTIQLIPEDIQQAALVEQYISVEMSEYGSCVDKYVYEAVFKKMHGQTPDEEKLAELRKACEQTLDVYNQMLEGKEYLLGDNFTLADICHLPYGHYAYNAGLDDVFNASSRPNVARWWKNISNQPAWQASIAN
jgi:glutathione S-transferase